MVEITPEDDLYRRLTPQQVNPDGSVNSAAYIRNGRPDPSISVDLARLTTPAASLARAPRPGFMLGALQAVVPMDLDFAVVHDPIAGNDAHALIEGENTKAKCRILARATRLQMATNPSQEEPNVS